MMNVTRIKKILSSLLCIVLIAGMALFTTGCDDKKKETEDGTVSEEGKIQFTFTVTDRDGNEKQYDIHTDKTIVGEALMEQGLLEGEDGPYGLFVKKVDGIEADFDKDGTYWAFYIDGEYAMTGVDVTEITEGSTYSFKVEK